MSNLKIPSCDNCTNHNDLFCGLTLNDRKELSENKGSNVFKSGHTIFYEGNQPHGIYCIHKGKVKLSKLGADGKEQIIRLAGKGEVLGYRSLLSNSSYDATATAIEDCEVCHISRGSFMKKMGENGRLAFNMIQLLSDNLKESEDKLISITQKTVRERIAQAILLLKTKFGFEEDGATLAVVLTRREIGEIANVTTETSIRTLSELKKEGVLELNQKKIKIADMKQLIFIANLED